MGQSPADWWYFGNGAGVHFTPTGPVADTNGVLYTNEGCATVSDAQGNLQFYTDGLQVYNALHDTMPNGDSLYGNGSSTQSSVIVPYPGSSNKYYIFTVRGCTSGGLLPESEYYFSYSIVDMTLENGLGDVVLAQKNVVLFDSTAEKCTATLHANGQDIWVMGRENTEADFYAYRLTSQGIVDTVVTSFGAIDNACVGYMIANHEGNKIAVAYYITQAVVIYDFNQSTGQFAPGPDTIFTNGSVYGLHFSPNDELLYTGNSGLGVWQYDLTAANVQSSGIQVSPTSTSFASYWAIAEGPDEKLYVSRAGTAGYISSIEFPDVAGLGCSFIDSSVFLDGRTASLGLPNNVAPGLFAISAIDVEGFCLGNTTSFGLDTTGVSSVLWNFGDSNSGSNTSSLFFPTHTFTDTGFFTVTLIANFDTLVDTFQQSIYIYPRQTLDLGNDTVLCDGDTLEFNIDQPFASFLWNDSSTVPQNIITEDELVWALVTGVCDTLRDSIQVIFDFPALFDLPNDTTFCEDNTILLDANLQVEAEVYWNTGDTVDAILVTQSGFYQMNAINACGPYIDSINVTIIPNPDSALLPPDTLNCFDNPIFLTRPLNDSITWVWSDSSDAEIFEVDTTMTIWLAASNECGFLIDTFTAVFNGEIKTELGEDTVICNQDSVTLFATDSLASYLWNTGDTSDSIVTAVGEDFNYVVTITLKDCQAVESKRIINSDTACPDLDCSLRYGNVFTPNGDGWNDRFRVDSDCEVFHFSMLIYNRWGQLVHESQNISYGWDGYVNGEPASAGTYYFTVIYKDFVVVNADRFFTRGSFTLIR